MSTTQTAAAAGGAAIAAPAPVAGRYNRSLVGDTWRRFRRHKLALVGAFIYFSMILVTLFGPLIWQTNMNDIDFAASNSFSRAHPLGTDDLGRDTLARVLWGGRVSLAVGLCAMLVASSIGVIVGALAGFFGGWMDITLSRIIEVFLSVPQLPLLLLVIYLYRNALVAAFGPELGVFILVVAVIGGLNWMATARLVRAGFVTQREREYVEAARCLGAGSWRIIKHILPNVLSPIIVAGTLSVGAAMIAESTLSFLGLGFPPDVPTWGRLLFDALNFLTIAPATAIIPGTMITLAVLSINFIGDGLRDALDPRRTL
ncbi:MAG TPA: ABC transporter permease [Chloroflexota bacterium]|nr:ABC transporter permease [Chloroflexota bacterium]